nr:hypothetical protein [Acidobacteriota bacterium]
MEMSAGMPGPARAAAPAKPMTPEQMKRGRAWMELAEAQSKGLEGGMRAYALLQVAKTLGPAQKKHALELLEDALAASRAMEDDDFQTRTRLQQKILQAMVPLEPGRADELLTQLDPAGRESVLRALLSYYRESKQTEHAIEMVYRISSEKEFPYGAGAAIMRDLPPEKQAVLQQMFVTALSSYRGTKHAGMTFGSGDFPAMIAGFYKQLSPDLVKEAISEVLKQSQAPAEDGKPHEPEQISVASAQGSVAMGSMYEYRLFQLIPALRAVDPDEAERLLKQNRDVAGMLEKYPWGAEQLQGPPGGGRRGGGGTMSFVGGGPGPRGGGAPEMDRVQMERMQRIMADADAHPQDALANVATLTSPEMKAHALEGIARAAWKKNSSVAKSALKQLLETLPQVELQQQILPARAAATLYLEMGEAAEARKTIEKGMESAAKLYKQDTDGDDSNKALKAYWPSANAYVGLLRLAGEIAPDWALEQLKEVPDEEIRALAQISMAAALLGQPAGPVTIATQKKGGVNMMQMGVE